MMYDWCLRHCDREKELNWERVERRQNGRREGKKDPERGTKRERERDGERNQMPKRRVWTSEWVTESWKQI